MRTRSKHALGAFACTFLAIGQCAWALTTPLQQTRDYQQFSSQSVFNGQHQQIFTASAGRFNDSEWDFAQGLAPNATGNLVFDTVRSLLQHWPNTRYRNGHTIVPGIVPPGTLLYHGTDKPVVPTIPEWTATDPEHSYLFCRQSRQRAPGPVPTATTTASPPSATSDKSDAHQDGAEDEPEGCWHLTLGTTRALRVLYFDGSSAAKMRGGPMHSQDLVAWGRVVEDKVFAERERIKVMCEWAGKWGVDGFVRMEMDFEVMLCDFTAGLEVVSFLNLSPITMPPIGSPRPREPPTDPTMAPNPNYTPPTEARTPRNMGRAGLDGKTHVLEAGSWHNAYPGETRIVLDYSRIVSLYDTALFPGLAQARIGVPRLKHALDGLDERDLDAFRARLEEVVVGDYHYRTRQADDLEAVGDSGVDWRTLFQTIAERYSARLERLPYILNTTDEADEAKKRSAQVHRAVAKTLVPYILYTAVPPSGDYNASRSTGSSDDAESTYAWAAPVWALCAEAHTRALERPAIERRMTAAERLLFGAAREVEREICRVLVRIWAEGRALGLDGDDADKDARLVKGDKVNYAALAADWRERVERLMQWLDWSVNWLRCRPACSFEEICVLPTWPYFNRPTPRFSETVDGITKDEPENDWEDPQPSCMTVIEPLGENVAEQEN